MVEGAIAIHSEVLAGHGGGTGLRSREILEAAVAAPQATMRGTLLVSDPIEVAGAYFYYLYSNDPFVDGNKRVALATCLVFLSETGLFPCESLDVDSWENLTLATPSAAIFFAGVDEFFN